MEKNIICNECGEYYESIYDLNMVQVGNGVPYHYCVKCFSDMLTDLELKKQVNHVDHVKIMNE